MRDIGDKIFTLAQDITDRDEEVELPRASRPTAWTQGQKLNKCRTKHSSRALDSFCWIQTRYPSDLNGAHIPRAPAVGFEAEIINDQN